MNAIGIELLDQERAEQLDGNSRLGQILALVRQAGFQSIDKLALEFGVTTQTIRRDVNRLCERGLCRRMHGGIAPLPLAGNVDYPFR